MHQGIFESDWSASALLMAIPMGSLEYPPHTLFVCDSNTYALINLVAPESNAIFWSKLLSDPNRTVLFLEAKPILKQLLAIDLDVVRPICLKTLQTLTQNSPASPLPSQVQNKLEAQALAHQLLETLEEQLSLADQLGMRHLARLECLVLRAFTAMEHHGLYLNTKRWRALIQKAQAQMDEAKTDAFSYFSTLPDADLFKSSSINLDSSQHVKRALEQLTNTTLRDTNQFSLAQIDHPAARAVLRYREAAKLVQTYGESFLAFVHPETSRIYATFEPMGASTGRTACHSHNLQNLPSDEAFHACFEAPPNKVLITADYAACELRILAALSKDPVFLDAFEKDVDVHAQVASQMFGVPVNKNENTHLRQRAKAINFGLMYGMGSKALAKTLDISEHEAEELYTQYFNTYPSIKRYLDHCVTQALETGYARTVLGRRLVFDPMTLKGTRAKSEISRIAKNMPIQGTGAEICKLAMLRLHERLSANFEEAFLVNMIHDEIVVECLEKDADAVAQAVKEEMENAETSLIPAVTPKADVFVGKSWKH